ncbi:MAG: hypothetical protein H6981_15405 [Gammaproteobacteria bacterium]|nr:hypothetical protein [Gammaproteobacteria bacterium]MCP5138173.1 hypothetical protein [Gammaproteobacteria bacterium]
MKNDTLRNTLLALLTLTVLPMAAAQARSFDNHDDAVWANDPRVRILGEDDRQREYGAPHDRDMRPTIYVRDADAPLAFRFDRVDYLYYKGRFYIDRGHHLRVVDAPVRVSERHVDRRPHTVIVPVH